MSFLNSHPGITGKRRTKVVPLAETDINRIVNRYKKTGQLPVASSKVPTYADVSEIQDLQHVLATAIATRRELDRLRKERQEEVRRKKLEKPKAVPNASVPPAVPPVSQTGTGDSKA